MFCPGGPAFAEKFCPRAGLFTTSKKFPRGLPGGYWWLKLTGTLQGRFFDHVVSCDRNLRVSCGWGISTSSKMRVYYHSIFSLT